MAKRKKPLKMYVWRDLRRLRDWTDGLMCVIATSKEDAIDLARDEYCGTARTTDAQVDRALAFRDELATSECEEIECGAVYIRGGS